MRVCEGVRGCVGCVGCVRDASFLPGFGARHVLSITWEGEVLATGFDQYNYPVGGGVGWRWGRVLSGGGGYVGVCGGVVVVVVVVGGGW